MLPSSFCFWFFFKTYACTNGAADGNFPAPVDLRTQMAHPLKLIEAVICCDAQCPPTSSQPFTTGAPQLHARRVFTGCTSAHHVRCVVLGASAPASVFLCAEPMRRYKACIVCRVLWGYFSKVWQTLADFWARTRSKGTACARCVNAMSSHLLDSCTCCTALVHRRLPPPHNKLKR